MMTQMKDSNINIFSQIESSCTYYLYYAFPQKWTGNIVSLALFELHLKLSAVSSLSHSLMNITHCKVGNFPVKAVLIPFPIL